MGKNYQNTIYDSKRVLGRFYHDENIVEYRKKWNFDVIEGRMGKP